jgi:hypothetical protein
MSFKSITIAATAAALVSISSAHAASVDLVSVDGIWLDPQPDTVYGISGVGTSALSWGKSAGYGQSGYTFDGAAPPVVTDVPVSTMFKLGTFTHHNNPIKASPGYGLAASITSATLQVTFGLEIDGIAKSVMSTFNFAHWETPNGDATCANGAPNGSGVNWNGCADSVTVSLVSGASETFRMGGATFMFDTIGFEFNDMILGTFWTKEKKDNSAHLYASYSVVPSPVPLPAAGWMLIAGLGGLLAMQRRKKS